ncbi:MAG: hypothetical protein JWN25_3579 [Verrucomicrobiales bacterium]|nr:hypothetical protein [Verrucomicrobiales bacterium]
MTSLLCQEKVGDMTLTFIPKNLANLSRESPLDSNSFRIASRRWGFSISQHVCFQCRSFVHPKCHSLATYETYEHLH